jgi:ABC-type uncharacterized transport system auxiliary subunit
MRKDSVRRDAMKHSLIGNIWNTVGRAGSLVGLLFALVGLAGCGSTRPVKYYQLTSPMGAPVATDSINAVLLIRMFEASHLLREDRIVFNWEEHQVGTYDTQRWIEPPVELLQDAMVRGLRGSGRFKSVNTVRGASVGDYVLSGHLYEFKEVDGSSIVARLAYDAQLRDRKTGVTLWRTTYSHDEVSASKDVVAVVAAMDRNVQQSVQQLQAGLEEYFRAHPAN